jgi:hypothetical protein
MAILSFKNLRIERRMYFRRPNGRLALLLARRQLTMTSGKQTISATGAFGDHSRYPASISAALPRGIRRKPKRYRFGRTWRACGSSPIGVRCIGWLSKIARGGLDNRIGRSTARGGLKISISRRGVRLVDAWSTYTIMVQRRIRSRCERCLAQTVRLSEWKRYAPARWKGHKQMDALAGHSWFTDCPHLKGTSEDPCLAVCESEGENAADLMAAVRLGLEDEGRRIRVRLGDDQRDPLTAKILADTLKMEGIRYVVGHFGSLTARAASVVYGQNEMLYLAPGSSDPGLCGTHAPTTLQFFGTDTEQVECLAAIAGASDVPTVIFAERNNYGAILAGALLELLLPKLARLQVIYGSRHGVAVQRGATKPGMVIILGSREFAQRVCRLSVVKNSSAELLFSDDSFSPSLLTADIPLTRSRVAFLERIGDSLIDRSAMHVCLRARQLLGRPPGPYFETSYIAIRALSREWSSVSVADIFRVQDGILRQSWPSPFGTLSLSNSRLVGHRWSLIPASGLLDLPPDEQVA